MRGRVPVAHCVQAPSRKPDREGAATAQLAFDTDGPITRFDDFVDKRQSKPHPSMMARTTSRDLVEPVKDTFMVFRSNADARIGYLQHKIITAAQEPHQNSAL